jgi:hypothetical protein
VKPEHGVRGNEVAGCLRDVLQRAVAREQQEHSVLHTGGVHGDLDHAAGGGWRDGDGRGKAAVGRGTNEGEKGWNYGGNAHPLGSLLFKLAVEYSLVTNS